jgi:hypothetical protein
MQLSRTLWRIVRWLLNQVHLDLVSDDRYAEPPPPILVDPYVMLQKEIGLIFQTYPSVTELYTMLPGISYRDAEWVCNACRVSDPVWAVIYINDVARAYLAGVSMADMKRHGLKRMLREPEYERRREIGKD